MRVGAMELITVACSLWSSGEKGAMDVDEESRTYAAARWRVLGGLDMGEML